MEQDTDIIMEDIEHNATTTRENRELRHQSKVHKHEHIEQQTDSMGKCSDKRGKTMKEWILSYRSRITKEPKTI